MASANRARPPSSHKAAAKNAAPGKCTGADGSLNQANSVGMAHIANTEARLVTLDVAP